MVDQLEMGFSKFSSYPAEVRSEERNKSRRGMVLPFPKYV
jgi:hypothetical protein